MNSLPRFLHQIGSRGLLLSMVGLLLFVKLGLQLQDAYQADQADLASRQASLARYQKLTGKFPELQDQLQRLTAERERLGGILFTGSSEENIISAMQLDLQALVTTAGLEAETIRPIKQKNAQSLGGETGLGEVAIKVSLNGTLAECLSFLAELYGSGKFYKVEAVTLSPYKKTDLKILIDLRGYFITTAPGGAANTESPAGAANVVNVAKTASTAGGRAGQPAEDPGI